MEITGTLRNAERTHRGLDPRAPALRGQIYGDVRGRFYDGEVIITSTVLDEEGDVFTTRNSVYKVESWLPGKEPGADAHADHETLKSCGDWAHDTFGKATIQRALDRAAEELDEAKSAPPEKVIEEIADVVICLAAAALTVGNLQDAINRKMAINRSRKWSVRGDGTGYHIKAEVQS